MLTNCIQLQSMHVVYSGKRLIGYGPYGIVSLSRTFFWFYLILKFFLPNPLCSFRSLAVFFQLFEGNWVAIKDLKWFGAQFTIGLVSLFPALMFAPLIFLSSLLCDIFVPQAQILIYLIAAIRMHCSRNFSMIITCQRKKGLQNIFCSFILFYLLT